MARLSFRDWDRRMVILKKLGVDLPLQGHLRWFGYIQCHLFSCQWRGFGQVPQIGELWTVPELAVGITASGFPGWAMHACMLLINNALNTLTAKRELSTWFLCFSAGVSLDRTTWPCTWRGTFEGREEEGDGRRKEEESKDRGAGSHATNCSSLPETTVAQSDHWRGEKDENEE